MSQLLKKEVGPDLTPNGDDLPGVKSGIVKKENNNSFSYFWPKCV